MKFINYYAESNFKNFISRKGVFERNIFVDFSGKGRQNCFGNISLSLIGDSDEILKRQMKWKKKWNLI